MKIAVHILAYNVSRFLKEVLANVEPHVDRIYIAYPQKPFGYVEASRLTKTNPTTITDIKTASNSDKIEIIQGDWLTEEDMRNACLNKAKEEGFDWCLIQDADEFYPESTWHQLKNILLTNKSADVLKTTWYNFWKSPQYVLVSNNGSIKGVNAGFAVRCNPKAKFVQKREALSNYTQIIDCPCYHYGYVLTDTEMQEKITTWGHAKDMDPNAWFKYKWLYWTEDTKYLHPTNPKSWHNAIRFPLQQPDFAFAFDTPINVSKLASFSDVFANGLHDTKIIAKNYGKHLKATGKLMIGRS